jgi:DNA repair protein RecN (Recombination protein N)
MGGTRLELRWQTTQDGSSPLEWGGRLVRFDATGVEWCELLIAANPGEEPRPMARIASGGELSRLHLAIRSVLRARRRDGTPAGLTLLFDEVDSGLGGGTAAALASLLAELAEVDQVMVVTHLPQVAARAQGHLKIEKVIDKERAVTRVLPLEQGQRAHELARMLAGDRIGESALSHARALLEGR